MKVKFVSRIKENIEEAVLSFVKQNGYKPNTLVLTKEEFYELYTVCKPWLEYSYEDQLKSYRNMKIEIESDPLH